MAIVEANHQSDFGKRLFLNEEFSDVEILIETDGTMCRFPCHKLILSTASEVFNKMFNSKFSEEATGKVIINDISPEIMLSVLRYIYRGHVKLDNWKTAIDVLRAAHKYEIVSLIRDCETYLTKNLTFRNVCFILDFALLYDLDELRLKCLTLCRKGAFVILKTRAFNQLSVDVKKQIISMNDLVVESRTDVFKVLWEWATMECCKRQKKLTEENIFGEFVIFAEYVRFQFMDHEELKSLPKLVFEYVCKKYPEEFHNGIKYGRTIFLPPIYNISEDLKHYLTTINFTFSDSSDKPCQGNSMTLLRFSVDCDVYLTDFTVSSLKKNSSKQNIGLFLLSSKNNIVAKWLLGNEETFHVEPCRSRSVCSKDNSVTDLVFFSRRVILLKAEVEYTMETATSQLLLPSDITFHCVYLNAADMSLKDVQLFVHSHSCYGITKMNFIRAIA